MNKPPDTDPPQKMTLAEARAFLRTRYPALDRITDALEVAGLKLVRFSQSGERGGRICGSLKFHSLKLGGYILQFTLEPSEVNRLREHGILPYRLRELDGRRQPIDDRRSESRRSSPRPLRSLASGEQTPRCAW